MTCQNISCIVYWRIFLWFVIVYWKRVFPGSMFNQSYELCNWYEIIIKSITSHWWLQKTEPQIEFRWINHCWTLAYYCSAMPHNNCAKHCPKGFNFVNTMYNQIYEPVSIVINQISSNFKTFFEIYLSFFLFNIFLFVFNLLYF